MAESTDEELLDELDRTERAITRSTTFSCPPASDSRGRFQVSAELLALAERQHVIVEELQRRQLTRSRSATDPTTVANSSETAGAERGVVHAPSGDQVADAVRQIGDASNLAEAATWVVKLAMAWTGATWAEVVEPPGERPFRILAATDVALARTMYQSRQLTGQNPPLPDLRPASNRIVIDDLAADGRWASLTEVAAAVPLRSAVLEYLVVEGRYCAGLAVYDPRPGYFTPDRLQSLRLLARVAAPLLAGAAAADRARHLDAALDASRTIGAAVGVVMQVLDTDQEGAFAELVRRSQHANRKLRELAAEIVSSRAGGLPRAFGESWPRETQQVTEPSHD